MKLTEIKTKEDIFDIADNWCQRLDRINLVWRHSETESRRMKACSLSHKMFSKIQSLGKMLYELYGIDSNTIILKSASNHAAHK